MRYLRVCLGSEAGDPGMTLYEVDPEGWVYRQVQLFAEGTRFAPEDILMCSPVNLEAMARHPAAEEIELDEFELLWSELSREREFLERLPNPGSPWEGRLHHGPREFHLQWLPAGVAPRGWARVPGFSRLFVCGGNLDARSACAGLFVDHPIEWSSITYAAA